MGKTILTWAAIAVLGFFVRLGWNIISYEEDSSPQSAAEERAERAAWIAEDDQYVAGQVSAGKTQPAQGWLDHSDHGTFEADPRQMRDAIEAFDDAGAVAIWIVEPEPFGGRFFADGFAVELPVSGPDREAVFAVEREMWGGDGTPDVGQAYLSVGFD